MADSLCDKCFDPGACCKRLPLVNSRGELSIWDDKDPVEGLAEQTGQPLPFLPLEKRGTYAAGPGPFEGRTYSTWWWTCPKVTPEGRCSIYESRPQTCRVFEPGSDPLCVHWRGAEGGEAMV